MFEFVLAQGIALAFPTLWLCALVIYFWGPEAKKALGRPLNQWASHHWFALGIFVSFTGEALDTATWLFCWVADYCTWECKEAAFQAGGICNIPFRYCATIIAAGCHLISAIQFMNSHPRHYLHLLITSTLAAWLLGLVFIFFIPFLF